MAWQGCGKRNWKAALGERGGDGGLQRNIKDLAMAGWPIGQSMGSCVEKKYEEQCLRVAPVVDLAKERMDTRGQLKL